MELSESKYFVGFTTLGFLSIVVYAVTVTPGSDSEVQLVSEMAVWEQFIIGYGLLAIFLNIFVAAFDAFKLGRRIWGWLSILAWPVSFVFVWLSVLGHFRRNEGRS